MPNVTAMASAPPTTRRVTATTRRDRATDALSNPVIRSPMSTATNATAIRADSGGTRMAMSGSSAPIVKASADEPAATQGLTRSC